MEKQGRVRRGYKRWKGKSSSGRSGGKKTSTRTEMAKWAEGQSKLRREEAARAANAAFETYEVQTAWHARELRRLMVLTVNLLKGQVLCRLQGSIFVL